MTRDDQRQAVVLVVVGFGMLVNVDDRGAVEQVAVAFRSRLQLAEQIRELFDVPAADVAHDALAVGAARSRSLAVAWV